MPRPFISFDECVYVLVRVFAVCYYRSRYWFYSAFKRVFDMNFYGNRFYDQHSNVGFTFILLSISKLMRAPFVKNSLLVLSVAETIWIQLELWIYTKFMFDFHSGMSRSFYCMQRRICNLAIYSSTFCIIFIDFFLIFLFANHWKQNKNIL